MATGVQLTDKAVMRRFPKVELHRHLEGAFFLPTLHRVALQNKLPYSTDFAIFRESVQFPKESEPDFLKFLSKFKNDWYRSHQDVYDIAYDSVRDFVNDGLFYVELRFSPEHFALQNNFDRQEVARIVIDAANRAAAETGLYLRFLITFNRGKQTQHEMLPLYESIRALKIPEIVGLDLAGDETGFPPEWFAEFFQRVHRDGFYKATIHAGEVSPPAQIWEAVNNLHAARIGHGTSSIEDEKLQHRLRETGVVLEQCITSNYQTGSWADERNHPLGRLFRNGVPVTINSDDPTIQDTDLTDDYIKAVQFFGLTVDDLVQLNLVAIEGSFVPETEKAELKTKYLAAITRFKKAHPDLA